MTQDPLPLPPPQAPPSVLPPLYLCLGIDPGMSSGWAITTMGLQPQRIASGCVKDCERDPLQLLTRLTDLRPHLGDYPVVVAIEDMPASLFKHRKAGEAFSASRRAWIVALGTLPRLVAPPIPLMPQAWRRVCAINGLARSIARKPRTFKDDFGQKVRGERVDWKGAARLWTTNTFNYTSKNDNECEALAIAYALAKKLHLGEVSLEPSVRVPSARKRPAPRSRG